MANDNTIKYNRENTFQKVTCVMDRFKDDKQKL